MKRKLTHFDQFSLFLFTTRAFLTWELAILKSEFLRIQIFLFGFVFVEIVNLSRDCQYKNVNEQIVENRIEIDHSEAEIYEFIHESCVFFITFFQPNILIMIIIIIIITKTYVLQLPAFQIAHSTNFSTIFVKTTLMMTDLKDNEK